MENSFFEPYSYYSDSQDNWAIQLEDSYNCTQRMLARLARIDAYLVPPSPGGLPNPHRCSAAQPPRLEALRLCAPTSRRVCLYRSALGGCAKVTLTMTQIN